MAMKAWVSLCALGWWIGLASCTPVPEVASEKLAQDSFQDGPMRAGLPTVMVLTPLEEETRDLWSALVLELKDEFNVVTVPVNRLTGVDDLVLALNEGAPSCIIVVDNRTLKLYRNSQRMLPERDFPPAVVVMTSFLDRAIGGLRKATGIAYEVPAVSSIVALRDISRLNVQRVGVVYRQSFRSVVKAQAELLAVEKVTLLAEELSDAPTPGEVEDSLDRLVVKQKVDVLWVLNDNRLLTAELLGESWMPVLDFQPVPVIVGVSALVHPEVHFGTLAVIPNHEQLGVQTANLVFDLYDNGWQLESDRGVELPLAVSTVVDVTTVHDHFGLKADALAKIDTAVK